ncbi:hypothetical protein GC722_09240 [Auraticoccus sp. F435]|uniref:Lipoprotein n=1 Tax=Auraticoccus cholistanensis TaxID=2656650 RepID=A0A6A9UTE6_9ACTN|nr:hypothetical protein [Auraticoccus cholistanensis]MVA76206.1 hypothetical protein [Auraticoccus cholistanensis]
MSTSFRPLWLAVPAVLLLAGCGNAAEVAIGEPAEIANGTLTVTEVRQGTAQDVEVLDLEDLQQHTPYFVRYQVAFEEGTPENEQNLSTALWDGEATGGEISPVWVQQLGDVFPCNGVAEVTAGRGEGCQLLMVEPGETLEAVEYAGRARWPVNGS